MYPEGLSALVQVEEDTLREVPQAGSPARAHSGDPGVREFPHEIFLGFGPTSGETKNTRHDIRKRLRWRDRRVDRWHWAL
jgi:hypothetical protein